MNDNTPAFTSDLFEFSAPSSLRLPAEIGQAMAVDGDSDEFGRVEYKLVEGDSSLKINGKTGLFFNNVFSVKL